MTMGGCASSTSSHILGLADPRPLRILICDDQPDILHALRLMLKNEGYQSEVADSPAALLAKAHGEFDVILADLNYTRDTTSGEEGLDLLAALEARGNRTPVVVMTAWGSIDLAVEAMRRGASDFIQKPWENARALATIRKLGQTRQRRQSELEIAASVQQRMFPHTAPELSTIDYCGHCAAAQGIGGDYYDFLAAGPGQLAFVLGDVSGKGVPAALLMANLQACFRSHRPEDLLRPVDLLQVVNRHLHASTPSDRFATLFFGVYDDATRLLRYVNCGHCPPMLGRASGEIERLDPTAPLLGAFDFWNGEEAQVSLRAGDRLVLYSDGVTEAMNESGEEFGEERLLRLLEMRRPARETAGAVAAAVAQFSGSTRTDDVTVTVICAR